MSRMKMLKNEKRNRRKAFWLTTVFYLSIFGGGLLYSQSESLLPLLPDSVKEVLPEWWVQPEAAPAAGNKPSA
ncbi:MAG: hypothetical protein AAFW73_07545 [Bacteroidota bacterium]